MAPIPPKPFYFIRHGETVSNAQGIVAGASDVALTEKGRQQARVARKILEMLPKKPAFIVHSPLSRARETALILNEEARLPTHEKASISERDVGDWTGISVKEWFARRSSGHAPPNGETTEVFQNRILNGFFEILTMQDEPALIVAHAGVFHAFLSNFGQTIGRIENCRLYFFTPKLSDPQFPWTMAPCGT